MSLRQLETLVDLVGVWIPRTGLGNFLTPDSLRRRRCREVASPPTVNSVRVASAAATLRSTAWAWKRARCMPASSASTRS